MLHFTAFIQNIARLKPTPELEISYQTTDYGFWGNIKDSKNSEFYIQNNPYTNIPHDQYGFWGLYKDDYSNIDINNQLEDNINFQNKNHSNNDLNNVQNKYINNLLNIVKSNENNHISKSFDYKCKFSIDKVKYNKLNEYDDKNNYDADLFDEEVLFSSKSKTTTNKNESNCNNSIKKINFVHLSNIFNENTDEEVFVNNFEHIKKIFDVLTVKYNPIKLYCGDILLPTFTNWTNLFNSFKFHAGIYGLNDVNLNNLNLLENNINKTNSIWLMSNLFHVKKQYLPITKCSIMMIIECKNIKIGLIGLLHSNDLCSNSIKYVDYLTEANRLGKELKERGVNIIVALTQMSWLHDDYLANHANNIDIIFGGVDSEYAIRQVNNCWIIKSGNNQKYLSLVEIDFNDELNKISDIKIVKISIKDIKEQN